ncbi:Lrp/AsnC ligand binding domain-containing protein [Mesorhizobium silamurunense]|uniref:Lrp/AsnC ligand binding domain-containing protein n=1 Tax=Mesorhizobium silamurunense TaxID=499528 RepID=UPI001FE708D0|nr:Lrp/AsnC family transcriptional regulator [Mesorhizobium silamurunense]
MPDRERLDLVDEIKRAMQAAKELTQCYMVTGDADFCADRDGRRSRPLTFFVKTKLYTNRIVRKFQSIIALDRVKFDRGPRFSFRRVALKLAVRPAFEAPIARPASD